MCDSVNIARIINHISILQEEEKVAKTLEEYLCACYKQALTEGWANIDFLERHLHIATNQVGNIQRRVWLLESMVEQFSDLKRVTAEILLDAEDGLKNI